METKDICLFIFDTKENFEKSKKNLGTEGSAFKRMICVEDENEFQKGFDSINDNDLAFMVVHVFYTDSINGIKRFVASRIQKKYPKLGFMYISEGDSKEINKLMIDADISTDKIYKYWQVQSNLEDEKIKVYTKNEIKNFENQLSNSKKTFQKNELNNRFKCDYAIMTALEESEMEQILPLVEKIGKIQDRNHLIEYGRLKSNPDKLIAYSSQLSTGMVDAAILATQLLLLFEPKILLMAGVLGGKPQEVKIGDVVVATKVFTIDKGKLTELGFKPEIEATNTDNAYITSFKREKDSIISFIKKNDPTRDNRINIHFGSITCVRQVIDVDGFFEGNIIPLDRKAIALEMESYGVARACEITNNGETIPLIIKSVMDNTVNKVDNAKHYAAWTSAMFIKYILENDLI